MKKLSELKTSGLCAVHDCYKAPLFRVNSGVPIEQRCPRLPTCWAWLRRFLRTRRLRGTLIVMHGQRII